MHYTGIGSRSTPDDILETMIKSAKRLAELGYTLRSGGANGADTAFEIGAGTLKEIYLPWRGFNGNDSMLTSASNEAFIMAEQFHPAWHKCTDAARKLHARNCHQVLGHNLQFPSKFILCWTPNAELIGGTAQALRIAIHHNIPIVNMAKPTWNDEIKAILY